jgi:hypothetical protein
MRLRPFLTVTFVSSVAVAVVLSACSAGGTTVRESAAEGGAEQPGKCCPIEHAGGRHLLGGWSESGKCPSLATGASWDIGCDCSTETDEHGCPRYRCKTPFPNCFDAGPDADLEAEAGSDAR